MKPNGITVRRQPRLAAAIPALVLVAAWSSGAEAQYPRSPTRPTTSAVGGLNLADTTATTAARGGVRELVCRGKPGTTILLDRDPSPRNPKMVSVKLNYQRSTTQTGGDHGRLAPGTCTWNLHSSPGRPAEPGHVYFDLPWEAQAWSAPGTRQMDTTNNAAVFYPDLKSLPRYLGEDRNFWRFYVDDASQVSISFGAYRAGVQAPSYSTVTGPVAPPRNETSSPLAGERSPNESRTSAVATLERTTELRCRGGEGLAFNRGGPAGVNLFYMTLIYPVSRSVAGATGRGLDPGTCAWADRTGIEREPGRIEFKTPGNAQLKQPRHT